MAGSKTIKVYECPECGANYSSRGYCYKHYVAGVAYPRLVERSRPKERITSNFKIVGWFHSRASAGLELQGENGKTYSVYMSDLFKYLEGKELGALTLEEVKKGTAYGWTILPMEFEQA